MLLAVPALRALGAAAPGAPLVLAAQPRLASLLRALGVVDRALAFDALGLHLLFAGAAGPARLPVLAQAERLVCWFGAGDPGFVARLRALVPGALVASPSGAGRPVWEHLLASVGAAPEARWRTPLEAPPALVARGGHALGAAGWDGRRPVLLVHPGAGGAAKRWPAEGFARVLERLAPDVALAVHRGPADAEPVARLRARCRAPLLELGEPALEVLAGVLARAIGYLGNDSGVSHLAAALGVPALVLFGAGNLAWVPWAPGARTAVVSTQVLDEGDVGRVADAMRDVLGRAES
ncbi:MAG: hypothetical protein A3E31_06565 [Candidatus Rokubacteria bacterium RIFCSPHIGHO2_12_FULL_73_22]|nr:MAG: hypothetical protein A3D33_04590 [Candidatus Rokubacteria bacterium RIFCSPHIGHO2_02_FULL_73_26]OGL04370.1 MAG: hypothetical protein A3E31_06565 [Candidatus Rokubacteria bacterium RIFCSPHIGHO2_12_FULL_73_22]OGL10388.1 MAG: hypothetical protein A3I14_09850 [Candidatus Rokubacteria bacterium RIFCSPLOWO2_02_FULL_73_56]OGL21721.1 MAG: hypothetical protein A3G44_16475 [Candidatus Rokubacteria bacterium RIFCSPLOWO2_12_FULL_73_47]